MTNALMVILVGVTSPPRSRGLPEAMLRAREKQDARTHSERSGGGLAVSRQG